MKKALFILFTLLLSASFLYASPSKEKKQLILYSPNSDPLQEVAYEFGRQNNVEVQILGLGTGDCLARIEAEAGNPQADVMYGGVNYANGINYAKYFEPYVAENDKNLPEAYRNQGGVVTRYCLDGSAALLINEEVFAKLGLNPDDFKGYSDLMNPVLKGHIAMGDPSKSSSAWAELTNMLLVMGDKPYDEKAWQWVKKFAAQLDGTIISSSSQIYKGTLNGEYAVGVSYEDPCVSLLVDGAKGIRLVYPSEGAVWLPAGAAIIKGAKNMETAKEFMDWLVSDAGQKEIAKTTARTVNPQIPNTAPEMQSMSEINVVYEDLEYCGKNKNAWQSRWTEIFQSVSK